MPIWVFPFGDLLVKHEIKCHSFVTFVASLADLLLQPIIMTDAKGKVY
jgi:hypothetical protein